MKTPPETLHRRTVASSRLFRIEALGLRFANGNEVEFERLAPVLGGGAVLLVPVTDAGEVLLIREYAAGTERYELGLPKGRVETHEDMLVAADRELREEVGCSAARMTVLSDVTLAPGYLAHRTRVVLAEGLSPDRLEGDEPEVLEVVPWRLDRLGELLTREDFTEARSIAALFLAREHLEARG